MPSRYKEFRNSFLIFLFGLSLSSVAFAIEVVQPEQQPKEYPDGSTRAPESPVGILQPELPPSLFDQNVARSWLQLTPYFALTNIQVGDKTTGSQANLASSMNGGVDVRRDQKWSEDFKSFVHLKLGALEFEQPTNSTSSLQSGNNFMWGFGIGGDLRLSRTLGCSVFVTDQKEAFVRATSTTSVTADAVAIPELGAKLSLDLISLRSWTIGASAQFFELFQASGQGYSISQGNLFGGALYVKQNVGRGGSAIQTELGYFSRQQNTNITNQTQNDLILQLRWFLPEGRDAEKGE